MLSSRRPAAEDCKRLQQKAPCTFDQLLRYIAAGDVPSDPFPEPDKDAGFPDMDTTAKALWTKDKKGKDWAGTINTGRVLTGDSKSYSKFLYQLGLVAVSYAESSPDNANLLKKNIQAIRTTRRNAQLTSFMESKLSAGIKVVTKNEPLYDGAPDDDDRKTMVIDAEETLTENPGLTKKDLTSRWSANTEGGHFKNVQSLSQVESMMKNVCKLSV